MRTGNVARNMNCNPFKFLFCCSVWGKYPVVTSAGAPDWEALVLSSNISRVLSFFTSSSKPQRERVKR